LEEYLEGRGDAGVCQPLGLSSANQQDYNSRSDGELERFEAWGPTRNDAYEWGCSEDVNNNWCRNGGWDEHNAVSDDWAAPVYERWDSPAGSEDSWDEAPWKRKAKNNNKRKIHIFADDIARKDLAGSERIEKLHQFVDVRTDCVHLLTIHGQVTHVVHVRCRPTTSCKQSINLSVTCGQVQSH
jgi:hypothetical protein